MRGTQGNGLCRLEQGGIIPADAGNTDPHSEYPSQDKDHPRGCGEHQFACATKGFKKGSSPRMRGTLGEDRQTGASLQDHPRGCGEHVHPGDARRADVGSSPRMRGTLSELGAACRIHRIIPADAGNTREAGRGTIDT